MGYVELAKKIMAEIEEAEQQSTPITPVPSDPVPKDGESDYERRFGFPAARLYPLLNKPVLTPEGTGDLVFIYRTQAGVEIPRKQKDARLVRLRPDAIKAYTQPDVHRDN